MSYTCSTCDLSDLVLVPDWCIGVFCTGDFLDYRFMHVVSIGPLAHDHLISPLGHLVWLKATYICKIVQSRPDQLHDQIVNLLI